MTLKSLATSLLLAAATLSPASAQEPLKVVASFSILGDMVRQIGGEHVEVATLVGPDGDAHVFEPTPQDARTIGGADLLVTNGLDFETWLPRLVKTAGFGGETIVATAGITPREFSPAEAAHEHEEEAGHAHGEPGHDHAGHDHGQYDPHAWQDLRNGEVYARNIAEGLAKADPANAEAYRAAGTAYAARLEALDTRVRETLAAIPADHRKVVTSHDAFGYFGQSYGIEFIAPEGISTEAEASAQDVAAIVDQIRREGISAVFVESITDRRLIERIADETGAKVGGELYSDALSAEDGPAPTYERMFENNAEQILEALKTS